MPIIWESKLDTGIDVIDHQHRRIVDYINDLEIAKAMGDKNEYEGWNFYSSLHKVTHWQPAPDPAEFWRNYSEVKAS